MKLLLTLSLFAALLAADVPVSAEIAVLDNGNTLKVTRWRLQGQSVVLTLPGGGTVGVPAGSLEALLPDEIGEPTRAEPAPRSSGVRELAAEAARRHQLDPALVLALIGVESGFRVDAVSPKGAQGLMQLMPATAAELGVADPFDAWANLDGGARHLSGLISSFGGDLELALAAYNAGEAAVERHGGIPPFAETREYVRRVLRRYETTR